MVRWNGSNLGELAESLVFRMGWIDTLWLALGRFSGATNDAAEKNLGCFDSLFWFPVLQDMNRHRWLFPNLLKCILHDPPTPKIQKFSKGRGHHSIESTDLVHFLGQCPPKKIQNIFCRMLRLQVNMLLACSSCWSYLSIFQPCWSYLRACCGCYQFSRATTKYIQLEESESSFPVSFFSLQSINQSIYGCWPQELLPNQLSRWVVWINTDLFEPKGP